MKKVFAVLMMIAILLLPSQAFAASSLKMTASEVNKVYFEEYNNRLKEVKTAIRSYKAPVCTKVASLASQSKQLTTQYNTLKKSKANQTVLSQAKATLDQAKKSLSETKKACSKKTAEIKKIANGDLKKITQYKTSRIKEILNDYNQAKITSDQFNKYALQCVKFVDDGLNLILKDLGVDPAAG